MPVMYFELAADEPQLVAARIRVIAETMHDEYRPDEQRVVMVVGK